MANFNEEYGEPSFWDRFAMWEAGVDEDTLLQCPQHDWENVRAIALLMTFVWVYQTTIFSLILHRVMANDGTVHVELVAAAAFIASMILVIDSYMVMRSSWHLHGIAELKRGGLDISGGWGPRVRNAIFLGLRTFLAGGIALLVGIFGALIWFNPDLVAETDRVYHTDNQTLIASVERQVDQDIQRASSAMDQQNARVQSVENQLLSMRNGAVDPAANDLTLKAALDQLSQLADAKAKREAELRAAQTFSANEMAGIKAEKGNTGKAGDGPVREGAKERVLAAVASLAAANEALAQGQARVDTLRGQLIGNGSDRIKQAQAQVPALDTQLNQETAQLNQLRAQLNDLTQNREQLVRKGVEAAPGHVGYDGGLLGQLAALKTIAHRDASIALVIILIDVICFGIELAAVLAKVSSYVPTQYAALVARNAYLGAVEIADEIDEALRRRRGGGDDPGGGGGGGAPAGPVQRGGGSGPANDNEGRLPSMSFGTDGSEPPRRRPGRPRKSQS